MNEIRDGHYTLGIAYLNAEAYDEAITHFQAVLGVDPTFIDAYHGLALSYFGSHRLQDARGAARKSLKLDATYLPALSFLQTIEPRMPHQPAGLSVAPAMQIGEQEQQQQSEVVSIVPAEAPIEKEKPPAVDETDIDKEMERGLVFLGNRQYLQAEAVLKKVIKASPQNALAHYHLAQAYMETGALNDARSEASEALRISPQYQPAQELKKAITFLENRAKQQRLRKQLIRYLVPLALLVLSGFWAYQSGVFSGILPQRHPPVLWIDTTLEDPANNNGYIDAGESVRLKVTISNQGGTAKDLKVLLLPKTIAGLTYQVPDASLNIPEKGFQGVRIPITADKKVLTRRVP